MSEEIAYLCSSFILAQHIALWITLNCISSPLTVKYLMQELCLISRHLLVACIVFDRWLYENVVLLRCKCNLTSYISEVKEKINQNFCCDPILIERNMRMYTYIATQTIYRKKIFKIYQ